MANGESGPGVVFDVTYNDQRNRLTTLVRIFTMIPHWIVMQLWGYVADLAAIPQWFVIVFTGRRNEGIWQFQRSWLAYASRVYGYGNLAHDEFPNFGGAWGAEPVAFDQRYVAEGNRLTTALRFLWIIPAAIINIFIGIGMFVVVIISWFAIVFTGSQPRGMFDFVVRALRFSLNLTAYGLLLTDAYPRFDSSAPTSVLPPGDHGAGGGGYVPSMPPAAPGQPLPPPAV